MAHSLKLCTGSSSGSEPQVEPYSGATVMKSLLKYQRNLNHRHSCFNGTHLYRAFDWQLFLYYTILVDYGLPLTPLLS